jgi:hypothetical protein
MRVFGLVLAAALAVGIGGTASATQTPSIDATVFKRVHTDYAWHRGRSHRRYSYSRPYRYRYYQPSYGYYRPYRYYRPYPAYGYPYYSNPFRRPGVYFRF